MKKPAQPVLPMPATQRSWLSKWSRFQAEYKLIKTSWDWSHTIKTVHKCPIRYFPLLKTRLAFRSEYAWRTGEGSCILRRAWSPIVNIKLKWRLYRLMTMSYNILQNFLCFFRYRSILIEYICFFIIHFIVLLYQLSLSSFDIEIINYV